MPLFYISKFSLISFNQQIRSSAWYKEAVYFLEHLFQGVLVAVEHDGDDLCAAELQELHVLHGDVGFTRVVVEREVGVLAEDSDHRSRGAKGVSAKGKQKYQLGVIHFFILLYSGVVF